VDEARRVIKRSGTFLEDNFLEACVQRLKTETEPLLFYGSEKGFLKPSTVMKHGKLFIFCLFARHPVIDILASVKIK